MSYFDTNSNEDMLNAIDCYTTALNKGQDGKNPDCHLCYSNLLKFQQKYNEAIYHIQKAGNIDKSLQYELMISDIINLNKNVELSIIKKVYINYIYYLYYIK